jgi:hypothetical protein
MSIPLKSAWSHSRLDRRRSHKDIPQPENVAKKTHDKSIKDSHRRPTERGASPTATSHSRTNRSSGLKNFPESKSASRGAQDTNTQDEYGSLSERGASPSTVAPSVLANVEINLLSSAPRPHPAYRSLRKERIRLLRILPVSSTAEIRCQLDDFSLRRPPAYTALSYTWGSQHGIHEIYVNDRPLLVPKNLFRFLNCARDLGGDLSGWIWCDMLSINQVDLAERGYQVTLMSRIFHTAQTVVVWLGPAHRGSDLAMSAIARISSGERFAKQAFHLWTGDAGHAMDDICRRNYWRRLWIFQELRLARRIRLMCGSKTAPWDKFQAVMEFANSRSGIAQLDDNTEVVASSPAMRMVKLNLKSVDTALWSLIQETKHLRCFDARDKVYALLGVATKGHTSMEPDYSLPLPSLLNRLLREIWRDSPPKNFDKAVDMCAKVEDAFGAERGTIFIMKGQRGLYDVPSDAAVRGCRLGPKSMDFSLWWTAFYGHSHMQTMLRKCWNWDWFKGDKSISIVDTSQAVVSLFRFLRNDMDPRRSFLAVETSGSDSDSDPPTDEESISARFEELIDLFTHDLRFGAENADTFDTKAPVTDLSMYWAIWYFDDGLESDRFRIPCLMLDLIINLVATENEYLGLVHLVKNRGYSESEDDFDRELSLERMRQQGTFGGRALIV